MPHVIKFVQGSTEIDLNTSTTWVRSYVPNSPDLSTIDFTPEAMYDGGERTSTTRRNVTETMEISLGGSSRDAVLANLNVIEAMLRRAEDYQSRRVGSPVYLQLQPESAASTYRSEILGGKVSLGQDVLSYEWRNRRLTAAIFFTRRFYWEGPEIEIPLWNSTCPTAKTGGIPVKNHLDEESLDPTSVGKRVSYVVGTGSTFYSIYFNYDACPLTVSGCLPVPISTASPGIQVSYITASLMDGYMYIDPWPPDNLPTWIEMYAASTTTASARLHEWGVGDPMGIGHDSGSVNLSTGEYYVHTRWDVQPGTPVVMYYNGQSTSPADSNYVNVAASSLIGAIPSPPIVKITPANTYGPPPNYEVNPGRLQVGINSFGTPASALFCLEAESGSYMQCSACSASIRYAAYYSAGSALYLSVTGSDYLNRVTWPLTTCMLNSYNGRNYHVFAKTIYPISASIYGKLRLSFWPYLTTLYETPEKEFIVGSELQDFGIMRLPPWLPGQSNFYPLELSLFLRTKQTGSALMMLDNLYIMPTDSWRVYEPAGELGLNTGVTLVDDGVANSVYAENWSPCGKTGHYSYYGPQLMLWPGQDQRITFLWEDIYHTSPATLTSTIRVYYRPRKLTI